MSHWISIGKHIYDPKNILGVYPTENAIPAHPRIVIHYVRLTKITGQICNAIDGTIRYIYLNDTHDFSTIIARDDAIKFINEKMQSCKD